MLRFQKVKFYIKKYKNMDELVKTKTNQNI